MVSKVANFYAAGWDVICGLIYATDIQAAYRYTGHPVTENTNGWEVAILISFQMFTEHFSSINLLHQIPHIFGQ